jgi:hypothetical protein
MLIRITDAVDTREKRTDSMKPNEDLCQMSTGTSSEGDERRTIVLAVGTNLIFRKLN